jgi:orotate phosphoribosyltransferase
VIIVKLFHFRKYGLISVILLLQLIKDLYPQAEMIAGVATGAIAHGVLVADKLGLPFIYVRSGAKEHGLGNQIEGFFTRKDKRW